ncbi:Homeodomain-like protein [Jimgerdemannia flammicorona]|uniref:Homeodomain-like protein n=1 Tax=Jimgerdemannia flammicorona TaxID=994334 RepID=A0A433PH67_9FUNG|nr:Homeodomain-like protein [Jimgerdemannia flammicorona]
MIDDVIQTVPDIQKREALARYLCAKPRGYISTAVTTDIKTTTTWTKDDDELLRKAYTLHGRQWEKIASMIPGKENHNCRYRWDNALGASMKKKTQWTSDEDILLRQHHDEYGRSWIIISVDIPGRTPDMCRRRMTVLLKRDHVAAETKRKQTSE